MCSTKITPEWRSSSKSRRIAGTSTTSSMTTPRNRKNRRIGKNAEDGKKVSTERSGQKYGEQQKRRIRLIMRRKWNGKELSTP